MAWALKPNLEKVGASFLRFYDCQIYLHLFLVFECTCWWCAEHGSGEGGKDEEAAGAEVAAKQPKRKRPPKKTVEQNLSNINSAESERRCEVRRTEGHHPVHLRLMIGPLPR